MQLNTTEVSNTGAVSLVFSLASDANCLSVAEIAEMAGVRTSPVVVAAVRAAICDKQRPKYEGDELTGDTLNASLVGETKGRWLSVDAFSTTSKAALETQTRLVREAVQYVVRAAQEAYESDSDKITSDFCNTFFPVDL